MHKQPASEPGRLTLNGFQIAYQVAGDPAAPKLLLLPTWQIVHSRFWKLQVPHLARFFRVITFDTPGNGGAERTEALAAFEYERIIAQAVGLLDHLGYERAAVAGWSRGCIYGLLLAACYPERVSRLILMAPGMKPGGPFPLPDPSFWKTRAEYHEWEKENAHYWRAAYSDWLRFFFGQVFTERHSTKGVDDAVAWGLQTSPEILIQSTRPERYPALTPDEVLARVRCPVLMIHGMDDRVTPVAISRALAETRPNWELALLEGCGHAPLLRDPVRVNLLITEFLRAQQTGI
jgi:pimeloyl-ACP methyl ester carboxylesterase